MSYDDDGRPTEPTKITVVCGCGSVFTADGPSAWLAHRNWQEDHHHEEGTGDD